MPTVPHPGSVGAVPSLLPSAGDLGEPDERVREAMAAATDRQGYLDAVAALCGCRLFMPVMAPGSRTSDGGTGVQESGAVLLTNEQGSTALLAFTGADSMVAWDSRARPVPGTLDDLAATVEEAGAEALLVDVAGPVPLVIGPDLLSPLAQGRRLVRLRDGGYGWLKVEPGRGDGHETH